MDTTIIFVDLVRFTSLTDVHGDVAGANAAASLVETTRRSLDESARLVKTLGDGVLVRARDPKSGLALTARIIEGLHDLQAGLDARAGVHEGAVVEREGDLFGSAVNLAARIADAASPGTVVVTRPVALAAADLGLVAVPLGTQIVSGFVDAVELFEIDPCDHDAEWLSDPVCGMRVEVLHAIQPVAVPGHGTVGFCSAPCWELFDAEPGRFVNVDAEPGKR